MKLIEEQYMQLIFTPCITSCSCDQLIMTYRLPQTKSNGYINHNSDYFPHRTVTLGPYIRSSVSASTNQPLPVFTTTPPAFQSPSPSNSPRPKQPYPPLSPHPCSRPLPSCSHHFHPWRTISARRRPKAQRTTRGRGSPGGSRREIRRQRHIPRQTRILARDTTELRIRVARSGSIDAKSGGAASAS